MLFGKFVVSNCQSLTNQTASWVTMSQIFGNCLSYLFAVMYIVKYFFIYLQNNLLVFAVSETSMDQVASNFAISAASFPPQTNVSRASIVTVVIDENVVRMTSNENVIRVTSNENVIRVTSSASIENNVVRMSSIASNENVILNATPTFEMATSFSLGDDQSINDGAVQVKIAVL